MMDNSIMPEIDYFNIAQKIVLTVDNCRYPIVRIF